MSEAKAVKMGFEQANTEASTRLGDCMWDAHSTGGKIVEFTTGRCFAEFEENELLRSAVGKMLEIMAEALDEMRRDFPDQFAKLEGGSELVEAKDSDGEVWRVVKDVVPEMTVQLQTMLDEWHQA